MPQMAPISWLSLFIMFSMILMMFCSINYYSVLPLNKKTMKQYKIKHLNTFNWKW